MEHKIKQSKENLVKRVDLLGKVTDAEDKLVIYPSVTQAFSSAGIPSLIIQSVLDDWQGEANTLLSQIRPGLQLSFSIEKEKDDGEMADTLDIEYFLNNRSREYGQLSGAQRVSLAFALKLGLAFLLQKMFGADVRLLLLDEIDQSLDKSGTAAFADIVKFFQKDFTILVITHNDKLKDKFAHAILVEQDQNMVSKAKVVSSWG
jgi:DNA repair exonuclease SbcCD ATPase subunit